jgi:DNA-binding transcriptional LysR family regulator
MSDSLEFRLLKYIVAVAETSNFTRAAERLFLAQPSLSKQIRDLEEEIRFPIFDRSRDGVRATFAGEMVVAYAKETLRSRDELVAMARAVYLGEVPPLRLGFSSFVTGHLLQSFRDTYCGMFPGCEIKLTGGDPTQVLQRINQRALDCAILPMPIDNDICHVQQISQSPLVICLRSDDPLAQQSQLDIHEIADRIKIGSKNVGPIYGLMLTAWGSASAFGPLLIAHMRQSSGSYASGLHVVAGIMAVSVVLPILVSPPKSVARPAFGTPLPLGLSGNKSASTAGHK